MNNEAKHYGKINVKHLINKTKKREKQKKTNIKEKLYSKCNAHTQKYIHTQTQRHSHVQTRTQLEAVLDALQLKINNIYIH